MHTTMPMPPAFTPCSTRSRSSRSIEPWCRAIRPSHCGRLTEMALNHFSAWDLVFVNTSVGTLGSRSSRTSSSIASPMCPAHGKRRMSRGLIERTTTGRSIGARTIAGFESEPVSVAAASGALAIVALRPHVRSPGANLRRRASASSIWLPRLLLSSSCHSSTMTTFRSENFFSASALVRSRHSDSGVVTSTLGRVRRWRLRTVLDVSPVRLSTVSGRSRASTGARRANSMSRERARRGLIYTMERPRRAPASPMPSASSASGPRYAAYVLPDPVGTRIRPLRPWAWSDQASSWNPWGDQPRSANQPRRRSRVGWAIDFVWVLDIASVYTMPAGREWS